MTPRHPDYDFPSLNWFKRHCWVSLASWLIYIVPTVMLFGETWWSTVMACMSVVVGLWRAKADRRIAAVVGYVCLFLPIGWLSLVGFVAAFWATTVKDGFDRNNPQPEEEWN